MTTIAERLADAGISLPCQSLAGIVDRPATVRQHHDRPNRNGSSKDRVMAVKALPSQEVLRQLLRYDPETGKLFWLPRNVEWFRDGAKTKAHSCHAWNARLAGKEAMTTPDTCGHLMGRVLGVRYMAHRIIWALEHGDAGDFQIDHINGDCRDNRLFNLRLVTHSENAKNCKRRVDNTSGVTGVRVRNGRYIAEIAANKKRFQLGEFRSMAEAVSARRGAEANLGFHENHGRTAALQVKP